MSVDLSGGWSAFWNSWSNFREYPGQIKSTIGIVVVLCLFFIIFSYFIKKVDPLGKTPKWLIPAIAIVKLINNTTKTNIGKRWKTLSPMFLTMAIFIFVANTCSIIGISNPTNYVVVTASLALFSFLIIQCTGFASMGVRGYFKGLAEPIFFMFPINLLSEFTLPLSLTLRLFGNILSSTVIAGIILGIAGSWGYLLTPLLAGLNVVFDIGFGLIQTIVFVILTIIFCSMKVKDKEKIYS